MKEPDWDRIQEIYHEAAKLPRSEQRGFIEGVCDGDQILAAEVIELLAIEDASFLDIPIVNLPLVASENTLVGTTIADRYFIEKELGHGGMSEVYLARDQKLDDRTVVIKFLARDLLENSFARQKFKKESEALSRIHHAGVVQVLDKGETADGRPYLVMEFVDGETLRSQMLNTGMNLERVASILKQVGAALEQAHHEGVFHRDLKPENILLRRGTDNAVLIDFGIAKVTASLVGPTTTNGQSAGTPVYMSPEQLGGERVTAASDIYSMAVIAYEMVTGRRPFNPPSASRLLEMQRRGVPVKPADLRPNLPIKAQDIILRGLSFKPERRFKSASEFGNELARALNEESNSDENLWPIPTATKRLIGIGALIILLGAAAWFVLTRPRLERGIGPPRFSYWLTVQKPGEGKDDQNTFTSNGQDDIFDSGDKFRLTVSSIDSGCMYVFKEVPPETSEKNFMMIYPNPAINNGSATLGANQSNQSEPFTFQGPPGDENFWIVWALSPVGELEAAKAEAFKDPRGGLTDGSLAAVKKFLATKQSEVKARVYHYKANQTAKVYGAGDILVTLAKFKHR